MKRSWLLMFYLILLVGALVLLGYPVFGRDAGTEIPKWQEFQGLAVGYGKTLSGDLVAGDNTDLVLQSNILSLTIATGPKEPESGTLRVLGQTIAGKPIDLAWHGMNDSLDWIDMPYISLAKPSGRYAWMQGTVVYEDNTLIEASEERIVVKVSGRYSQNNALTVTTEYVLVPDKPWILANSVLTNNSEIGLAIYVGDILQAGGAHGTGVVSGVAEMPTYTPQEFEAVEPWMGQHYPSASQVVGLRYASDLPDLCFYGLRDWVMSYVPVELAPGDSFLLDRYIICASTREVYLPEIAMSSVNSKIQEELTQIGVYLSISDAVDGVMMVDTNTSAVLTIQNDSLSDIGPGQVQLYLSPEFSAGVTIRELPIIGAGETYIIEFPIRTQSIGNALVGADVLLDAQTRIADPLHVFIDGPGWYNGDTHVHSTHSDGSGTVAENVGFARRKGLHFLISTDHNTVKQAQDVANENRRGFVSILGSEITAAGWHGNALFIREAVTTSRGPQYAIDKILEQGGLFFINHPFMEQPHGWLHWDVHSYTGMEVWQALPITAERNQNAFAKWNELLNEGKRVIGMAATDAHNPQHIGEPRICVYLNRLSEAEIYYAIKNGHFYGTNGPDIRFEVNGEIMGSTVEVRAGETVAIDIVAWSDNPLTKVSLIKNGEEIKVWRMSQKEFVAGFSESPSKDSWYRMEVTDSAGGFAFTNPVWVEVQ